MDEAQISDWLQIMFQPVEHATHRVCHSVYHDPLISVRHSASKLGLSPAEDMMVLGSVTTHGMDWHLRPFICMFATETHPR